MEDPQIKGPRCELPLDLSFFEEKSRVLVDACWHGCGVWVDDGEVRDIFRWLRTQEPPPSPAPSRSPEPSAGPPPGLFRALAAMLRAQLQGLRLLEVLLS